MWSWFDSNGNFARHQFTCVLPMDGGNLYVNWMSPQIGSKVSIQICRVKANHWPSFCPLYFESPRTWFTATKAKAQHGLPWVISSPNYCAYASPFLAIPISLPLLFPSFQLTLIAHHLIMTFVNFLVSVASAWVRLAVTFQHKFWSSAENPQRGCDVTPSCK